MTKVTKVSRPDMLKDGPDAVRVIVENGTINTDGFVIKRVELRMYLERTHTKDNKPYTLVTAFVDTDRGATEITFDEGFGGLKLLDANTKLLVDHLGLSALLLRSTIALCADEK